MRRLLPLLLVSALAVTACGSDAKSDSSAAPAGLSSIDVSGTAGKAPTVENVKGYSSKKVEDRVVKEGTGEAVADGDTVSLDYVLYRAKTGKTLASTYSQGTPVSLQLDQTQDKLLAGSIVSHKVGSRFVVGAPATDFYGDNTSSSGVAKTETLVLVAELVSKFTAPKPNGTIADVTVTGAYEKLPVVKAKPNLFVAATQSKVLVAGKGAPVKKGAKVTVRYVGVDAKTGKTFDSSYADQKTVDFTLADGQLITGFITGLTGKRLGSRVLVTIPYTEGYGPTGNPQAGIAGGDSLIFVVDLIKLA